MEWSLIFPTPSFLSVEITVKPLIEGTFEVPSKQSSIGDLIPLPSPSPLPRATLFEARRWREIYPPGEFLLVELDMTRDAPHITGTDRGVGDVVSNWEVAHRLNIPILLVTDSSETTNRQPLLHEPHIAAENTARVRRGTLIPHARRRHWALIRVRAFAITEQR